MNRSQRIRATLESHLEIEILEVLNESANHNVPPGSESHFRLLVVSPTFASQSRLQRHRALHQLLSDELDGSLHALAIDAWTPEEWAERGGPATSPKCLGGGRSKAR